MSNETVSQLPTVTNALLSDVIYAIQGGTSSQETLQQVFNLMLSNTVLNFAGDPNGNVAGSIYQLCWDSSGSILYVCTTTGSTSTAVWTPVSPGAGVVSPSEGGTGVSSPTAHTLPVAEGASNFTFLGPLSNGQLLIGSAGANPVPATITAGTNISIVNSAGGITINATGLAGIGWQDVSGTSQAMTADNGYVANNAGLVTLTLPLTASFGSLLYIQGLGAGGWTIAQNSGQNINIGSSSTTVGAGGSVSSTDANDSLALLCVVADTTWSALGGVQGNLTIV